MAFKMKGISSLTNNSLSKQIVKSNSPLLNTDPSGKSFNDMQIEVTNSVKDLQGDDFATERIITKKGKEVEKQLVPEDFEGGKNNPEYQKKLAALKIAMEQGKDAKYKDQKIDQVRDYTSGLVTKPGSEFHDTDQFAFKSGGNRYFKQREGWADGYDDEAFETGDFLSGLITKGGGDGDAKNYITSEEAMRLYQRYNKQIDRPGQPKQSEMDPNDWTSIHNWNNWRKQRGLDVAGVSYQKGVEPTTYKNTENKGNWRNKN